MFFTAVRCLSRHMSKTFADFLSLWKHHMVVVYRLWQTRISLSNSVKQSFTLFRVMSTCHWNAWLFLLLNIKVMTTTVKLWNYMVLLPCCTAFWNSGICSTTYHACALHRQAGTLLQVFTLLAFSWCISPPMWTQVCDQVFLGVEPRISDNVTVILLPKDI